MRAKREVGGKAYGHPRRCPMPSETCSLMSAWPSAKGFWMKNRCLAEWDAGSALTVTHIFLLWAQDLISLADLAASGGRARDRTCSMKRVVGPRPSSGRLTLGMPDAPTVS